MLHRNMRFVRLLAAGFALALAVVVFAQAPHQGAAEDALAHAGRVASFSGELYLAPPDRAEEWSGIGLNYPVATGDNVWASADGRAEVDYGGGQFRLGGDTNLHVSRLDDRQLALFVAQGHVVVRVRVLDPGESARVDTPNAQIELVRPGLYRIDVSPEPRQTWLMVREGEANVALPSGLQQVLPGQTAAIAGIDSAVVEVRNGVMLDGLDTWSADRDRVYERGRQTTAYVSRQMVGYADLDANGRWETNAEYGAVWYPTAVADDWAPYRYGRWTWVSTFGWTWVDDAPWGYAPFHYGRWAHVGGRWGWCPGAYVARPVWAPALVGWYGGNGWSYSASYGAPVFGWVPLGWRDPYAPGWGRCGARCYERYNRPYAVNVAERGNRPPTYYANSRVPGAVTAVPGAAFREARPVHANRVPLSPGALASAPVLGAAPPVRPLQVGGPALRPGRGVPQPAGAIAAQVRPSAVAPAMNVPGGPSITRPAGTAMPAPGVDAFGGAPRPTFGAPPRPGAAVPGAPGGPVTGAPGAAAPGLPTPAVRGRLGEPAPAIQVAPPAPSSVAVPAPPMARSVPPAAEPQLIDRTVRALPPPAAPQPAARAHQPPLQQVPQAALPPAPRMVQPLPPVPQAPVMRPVAPPSTQAQAQALPPAPSAPPMRPAAPPPPANDPPGRQGPRPPGSAN